jgi:hypothetical protein
MLLKILKPKWLLYVPPSLTLLKKEVYVLAVEFFTYFIRISELFPYTPSVYWSLYLSAFLRVMTVKNTELLSFKT